MLSPTNSLPGFLELVNNIIEQMLQSAHISIAAH